MKNNFIEKNMIIILFLTLFSATIYSETLFRVSGKVVYNGKGVKGVMVTCSRVFVKGENSDLSGMKDTITNDKGEYFFELKQGEYWLGINSTEIEDGFEELKDPDLPLVIKVKDKSIINLNFHLYTEKEVIEANKDVFELVDKSKPFVKYEYGIIPLYSKEECDKYVRKLFDEDKREHANPTEYEVGLKGAHLEKAVTFYDLRGNPILYYYPVIKNGIEVSMYEIFAIGDEVSTSVVSGSLMDNKSYNLLIKNKENCRWLDSDINDAIESFCEKYEYQKKNIKFLRLISSLLSSKYVSLGWTDYILIKILPLNKITIINFYGESFPLDWSFEKMRKWYERKMVFEYIKEVRKRQGKPLMRDKK